MTIMTIGDSITRGTFTAPGDNSPLHVANPNFSDILKGKLNADKLINHGINGVSISTIAEINRTYAMSTHIDDFEDLSRGDFLFLCGGTNDQQGKVPIGIENDTTDISFFGGIDVFFSKAKKKYADNGVNVFVVLPLDKRYSFGTTDLNGIEGYRRALELKAKKFGFNVVDTRKIEQHPDDESWREEYMLDGLHPNEKFHKIYGEFIFNEIKFRRNYENRTI